MWRKTPQTLLIIELLKSAGHATNQELAAEARKTFPSISNTSVHRITSRLIDVQIASNAPNLHNIKIIDANPSKHDHFLCQACGKLIDLNIPKNAFHAIQSQLPGQVSRHGILIAGVCEKCET